MVSIFFCNCLVDHQVHAALAKTALFEVNNDCKGIQRHYSNSYSNSLYAKRQCTQRQQKANNKKSRFVAESDKPCAKRTKLT